MEHYSAPDAYFLFLWRPGEGLSSSVLLDLPHTQIEMNPTVSTWSRVWTKMTFFKLVNIQDPIIEFFFLDEWFWHSCGWLVGPMKYLNPGTQGRISAPRKMRIFLALIIYPPSRYSKLLFFSEFQPCSTLSNENLLWILVTPNDSVVWKNTGVTCPAWVFYFEFFKFFAATFDHWLNFFSGWFSSVWFNLFCVSKNLLLTHETQSGILHLKFFCWALLFGGKNSILGCFIFRIFRLWYIYLLSNVSWLDGSLFPQ